MEAQVALLLCILGSGVSHPPLDNWPDLNSIGMVIKPVISSFDIVDRCKVNEKEISMSVRLVSGL